MPALSRKSLHILNKKQKFIPPLAYKENISLILNEDSSFTNTQNGKNNFPSPKKTKHPKKSKNNGKVEKGHGKIYKGKDKLSEISALSFDLFQQISSPVHFEQSSDKGSILSEDILNRKEVKEKYIEFWNESLTPDIANEFNLFSQEFLTTEDEPSRKKTTNANLSAINGKTKNKAKGKIQQVNKKAPVKPKPKTKTSNTTSLDLYEKMRRIHESRNVGLYVICDYCDKHRYLPNVTDPLELPDKWFCSMNPDPNFNNCTIREEAISDEEENFMIYNLYNSGSVVWGKIEGYPWWPAMVEDDPDVGDYYWLEEGILQPTYYHVTFFDKGTVSRAWLKPENILPFERNIKNPQLQLPINSQFSSRLKFSIKQAEDSLKLSLLERLRNYSFIVRFKAPFKLRGTETKKPKPVVAKKPQKPKRKRIIVNSDDSSFEDGLNGI